MIGVLSQGRMGNQMFQLAFIHCAAKRLGTDYFIYGSDSLHYFECQNELDATNDKHIRRYILRNIFRKSEHKFHYSGRKALLQQCSRMLVLKNVTHWPNQIGEFNFQLTEFTDNCLYTGFFQSENYFLNADSVRKMFTIKEGIKSGFSKREKPYSQTAYIAVHLRRSDYLNYGSEELGGINMTLPAAYYHKCLELIRDSENTPVVFVSDDIEFVKKEFGTRSNYFFESNDEITDFQIMLHASTVVLANSTFSWWAAWLNEKQNKVVYAPDYFLGFKIKKDYPGGIRVKSWNWINVGGLYA
jgi:hypothetical protein